VEPPEAAVSVTLVPLQIIPSLDEVPDASVIWMEVVSVEPTVTVTEAVA